ncbi:MAG: trypsin-like peptidase domain-containing protein [Phycisphaerales bacterium]
MGFVLIKAIIYTIIAMNTSVETVETQRPSAMTMGPDETSLEDLFKIESTTKEILGHISAATVSVRSGYGGGSGAIIREDGLILTAAHVAGVPDEELMVTLADGRVVKARVLGCDHEKDIALAVILDQGTYPYVKLADSVLPGQWCLAMGHPGGLQPGRSAVLRVSKLSGDQLMDSAGVGISSTASLINGDSGGPLFNLQGEVIGVHRAVDPMDTERSFHSPVSGIHDRMDALLARQEFGVSIMNHFDEIPITSNNTQSKIPEGSSSTQIDSKTNVDLSDLPEHIREMIESGSAQVLDSSAIDKEGLSSQTEEEPKSTQTRRVLQFKIDPNEPGLTQDLIRERLEEMGISREKIILNSGRSNTTESNQNLFESAEPIASPFSRSTARVMSDGNPVALGVVVDADGYIVSKASELVGSVTVALDETIYDAETLAVDELNDLALLKIEAVDLTSIVWDQINTPEAGTFLVTPGPNSVTGFGALSHGEIPQRASAIFSMSDKLGIKIKRGKRLAQIDSVHEGGPAQLAGFEAGDLIVAVNGTSITNGASFLNLLHEDTDHSTIELTRLTPKGIIEHISLNPSDTHLDDSISGRRAQETLRVVSEMAARVSTRSRDFPLVFYHDSAIKASDCGGPLVDLEGRVIGMNIARLDRTTTVAIPSHHVAQAIDKLLDGVR